MPNFTTAVGKLMDIVHIQYL